jgi:hypothetical protein
LLHSGHHFDLSFGVHQTGSIPRAAYEQHEAPDSVAQAIHASFSKSIINQLVSFGASRLGAEIARVNPDSLLASPGGRRFVVDILDALGSKLRA